MIRNHGVSSTIIFHKEILRFIQQSCMNQGTTLNQNVLPFWTRTKRGYPQYLIKGLGKPIEDLMKDLRFRQGLLTICNYYKSITAPISYDLSTVTQVNLKSHTHEYRTLIEEITNHFQDFLKVRSIFPFTLKSDNPVFATPKASANGSNAMGETSVLDAMSIFESKMIYNILKIAHSVFTKKAFKEYCKLFRDSISMFPSLEKKKHLKTGRLHFLQEGGGKTRVICIPDIWSQCVLKPIHDYLYEVIRRFPCDGTFSHSKIASRVRKYTKTGGLICYDLKAATDRMPVDLQEKILGSLIGNQLASQWRKLLCDRDYHTPVGAVRYAVGQPMGFLTSWITMAITHHAIINYAKKDKSFYAIIGDDIVIASKKGAESYKRILEVLGMEISEEKSITSSNENRLGEIAKRLFIDGGEISPIPPDILIKSTGTLVGFMEFIRVFSEKFHHADQGGFSDAEYQRILNELFLISSIKDDDDARVLLTCPILDNFPILPTIPPLKEVKSVWKAEVPKIRILRDFEQFFLELCNKRTNEHVMNIEYPKPVQSGASIVNDNYPLYKKMAAWNKSKLNIIIKRINTTYVDEEADSFAEGPIKDIRDILSFPNPSHQSTMYLSKRVLRLRNTHSVIQQFLDVPRFKAMYRVVE